MTTTPAISAHVTTEERAAFEAVAPTHNITIERFKHRPDKYKYEYTISMFKLWQAAWSAALAGAPKPCGKCLWGDCPPCAAIGAGDTELLDSLGNASWNLECFDMPTGGDDSDIGWRVVEHHMEAPHKRTVAEVYEDSPRKAIRAAMQTLAPTRLEGETTAPQMFCLRCNGEGSIHIGIDESPTEQCKRCDGTGLTPTQP